MLKVFFLWENAKSLFKRQEGQGLVEYALIIALVSVLLVTALGLFETEIEAVFTAITTALGAVTPE